jgi:hypothetical protein
VKTRGGLRVEARNTIGWDAAEERIVEGGVNSIGGHYLSTVTYDDATQTWTGIVNGADGNGEAISNRAVTTMKDKNTYELQVLDRQGGFAEGDSPKYSYTRVERRTRVQRHKVTK